ncbi:DUF4058 family protein [Anaerolineales bacterium HSG6]|nr:DUF4058 family protein [Anaerolineales bacterium HSG6]
MKSPFPGMNPYLEHPNLWEQVHHNLINDIQLYLAPKLRPQYRVSIEQMTYLSVLPPQERAGKPDVLVVQPPKHYPQSSPITMTPASVTPTLEPFVGHLPMADLTVHRYLTVKDISQDVVTVIELLSPANKNNAIGRQKYLDKRYKVLGSLTNLVELDLLRGGRPMPMEIDNDKNSDYRIVISRPSQRPQADIYLFRVRDIMPDIPVPLRPNDQEVNLPLNQLLHILYEQRGYDLVIDYTKPPQPQLNMDDIKWASSLIEQVTRDE